MKNFKAQVTVFIIVGIVILLLAGILIYSVTTRTQVTKKEALTEEVPLWSETIKTYIENCLQEKTIEAFTKLGEHGGYIAPKNIELSSGNFNLDANNPTESDGLIMFESPIIYWFYLESPNRDNTLFVSDLNMPSLEFIESQVNIYINQNLDSCLDNFGSFKEQGFKFNLGKKDAKVSITQNNILTILDYKVNVEKDTSEVELNSFSTQVDINFRRVYDISQSIKAHQESTQSLEEILLELIGNHAGVDYNMLPPISSIDDELTVVRWQKPVVKQRIQELLTTYSQLIKVKGSKNAVHLTDNDPHTQKIYDKIYLDIFDETFPTINIDYLYLNYPIYFDISPSEGDIIKPHVYEVPDPVGLSPPLRTNVYEFDYDISYPFVVKITDDEALNNKGYNFMFSLEANIRDNKNLLDFNQGRGTVHITPGTTPTGAATLTSRESLFCNDVQRIRDFKINVKDLREDKDLEGVSIKYGCGDYRACSIGVTNNEGNFEGKLPFCIGGYLLLEKRDYESKAMPVSTETEVQDIYTGLEPYREFEASLMIYDMEYNHQITSPARELNNKETAILTINKVTAGDPYETAHQDVLQFEKSSSTTKTLRLVPGQYEVSVTYIDENEFTLPKECIHLCRGLACILVNKYYPEETKTYNNVPLGGANLNDQNSYWYVDNSMDHSNKIEFYIIRTPTPTCIKEPDDDAGESCDLDSTIYPQGCIGLTEEISNIQEYSNRYRTSHLEPSFS